MSLIPIFGVLTQYGDYGTTSMTDIGAQFDTAMRNSAIGSIVLAIDSPGGVIQGTPELAKKIYASRGLGKQIVAVAAPDAASAAIWIGSAAEKLYIQPSGSAGSIGVWTMHQDWSVAEEQVGVKTTLIASEQSPHKVEAHPFGPLDSEARAELQRGVNSSAAWFIGDVARHRGVTEQTVPREIRRGPHAACGAGRRCWIGGRRRYAARRADEVAARADDQEPHD